MSRIETWLESAEVRTWGQAHRPGGNGQYSVDIARGGRKACQAVIRYSQGIEPLTIDATVDAPDGISVRVRRVGMVPLPHYNTRTEYADACDYGAVPVMVPDPLYDDTATQIGGNEAVRYWLTISADEALSPGIYPVDVQILVDGEVEGRHRLAVGVRALRLQPPRDLTVVHWFYSDALLDWYKREPFDEGYWSILPGYVRDLRDHGVDTLYVPLFSAPTDGERRPAQLLSISPERDGMFDLDFDAVARYVRLGKQLGFSKFEWPHLFSQWGAGRAIPLYHGQGAEGRPLMPIDTGAQSKEYRAFLEVFLPRFRSFLEAEGVLNSSFFHVSDEPHGEEDRERYRRARGLIADIAPWMKTMDAVSELQYGREGLTDLPVPTVGAVGEYIEHGIECFTYYCCGQRGRLVNRFLDTPLPKIRALGWLLYRYNSIVKGFLHWGYNYWYRSQTRELIDPFSITDGGAWPGWAYGDTFVVYPGPDGPIDSIRWEAFAEGLDDFALLQSADIDPDSSMLAPLVGFDDFPTRPEWYMAARAEAFRSVE